MTDDEMKKDWWALWQERCELKWALFDIENRAKMMGDWATARMARRGRIGKAAVAAEDAAAEAQAAANKGEDDDAAV